jgi:O-antigen/teichoic acid export membrane protein
MSANPLKKLAGETAIYGMSTILARFINFIFVPIYTRMLTTGSYGIAAEFLAYIAMLQVILTLGLETGCFNFANKHDKPSSVFSNALLTVGIVSLLFFISMGIFAGDISSWLKYDGFSNVIWFIGSILAIDSFTSILFAKIRFEHRPIKFAVFKTIKILSETLFNFLLFFVVPSYLASHPDSFLLNFVSATPDFTYIIFAIFLSGIVSLVLFIPDMFRLKFNFNPKLWREMMLYSLPLMAAGLPGILNDFIDRPLFRFFSPEGHVWQSDLGIFQAWVKFATLMMLFIQMFRYAAEPFFFSRAKEAKSKELYASVMEHFTAFCMFIFLGMMMYLDIIALIIGRNFHAGVDIVPIMLLAYVILGMNFNVSMWYKLSGKTNYAIYITMAGLPITILINIIFMPIYSYHAAAWGHLLSYLVMFILSVYLGNKHYPIPYDWKKIITYIGTGILLYLASLLVPDVHIVIKYAINTILLSAFVLLYLKTEKITLWKLKF